MISFSPKALEHLSFWIKEYRKMALQILRLIIETEKSPFTGIGKPEPLKGDFKGYWSRKIDDKHRLVYKISPETLITHSCFSHYNK
jgi:toxin YoeB